MYHRSYLKASHSQSLLFELVTSLTITSWTYKSCAPHIMSWCSFTITVTVLMTLTDVFPTTAETININEFRCYGVKLEESEKATSGQESNPGHLWLEPPVLCHWMRRQPDNHQPSQSSICLLHRWFWMPQLHITSQRCPGFDCRLFHFPLFSVHKFLYFRCEARSSEHFSLTSQEACVICSKHFIELIAF